MKSSFELAMERLNKTAPTKKITNEQKKKLADLDSKYAAKIAEHEIALQGEIVKAALAADLEKIKSLEQKLIRERKSLQNDLEEKKNLVRK